jgi:hypothetical protein
LKTGLVVALSCLLVFSIGFFLSNNPSTSHQPEQQTDFEVPKAALLDGLYNTLPNETFTSTVTNLLTAAGYHVDVFRGENVTITLLKDIAGYKLIILRVHSGIFQGDHFLYLFSGENYTQSKYVSDQLSLSVREAVPLDENETYFALNAVFLGSSKPYSLKDTTIILMGCNGTGDSYSVKRLLDKGAKSYVGWDGYVTLSHSDKATSALVKALYTEKLSVKEAVDRVMKDVGADPSYKSILEYRSIE